jgi:hypothetical protein
MVCPTFVTYVLFLVSMYSSCFPHGVDVRDPWIVLTELKSNIFLSNKNRKVIPKMGKRMHNTG